MDKDKALEYLRGLEKLKAARIKDEDYSSPLAQEVMNVKGGSAVPDEAVKIKNMTDKITTKSNMPILSGEEFRNKIAALTKGGGKKVLSALPMAGVIGAALQGDPAMAAEETLMDAMGPAGESMRSESLGMSPDEEAIMLAEDKANKEYGKSPARLARLKALLGK